LNCIIFVGVFYIATAQVQEIKKTINQEIKMNIYQENLKKKMDKYVRFIYSATKNFPKDETYGVTSQLRRAALSVILNYIEGYARRKLLVRLNFLEISYGSIQETKYLLDLSLNEKYLKQDDYNVSFQLAEEIGAMLWKEIMNIESKE